VSMHSKIGEADCQVTPWPA